MDNDLDEWLEVLVAAESMVKVRRAGFCYLEQSKIPLASMLCVKIGVNFEEWLNTYFDYDIYN